MSAIDGEIECAQCGAVFTVAPFRPGHREKCPVCRSVVTVPGKQQAEEPEPATPAVRRAAAEPAAEPPCTAPDDLGESEPVYLCCRKQQTLNPVEVAPVLTAHGACATRVARRRAARDIGLLAEHIYPSAAKALQSALAGQGIETFVVPVAAVPTEFPRVKLRRLHGVDERALCLEVGAAGELQFVPWQRVAAGFCTRGRQQQRRARIRRPEAPMYGPRGARMPSAPRVRWERPREELRVALLLRAGQSGAELLSVDRDEVRYSYLGDRMKPGGEQNLTLLLGDILRWSEDGTFFTVAFREAAEGRLERLPRAVGTVDYREHLQWVACCAAARGLLSP